MDQVTVPDLDHIRIEWGPFRTALVTDTECSLVSKDSKHWAISILSEAKGQQL